MVGVVAPVLVAFAFVRAIASADARAVSVCCNGAGKSQKALLLLSQEACL